jgi:hypothetical protein
MTIFEAKLAAQHIRHNAAHGSLLPIQCRSNLTGRSALRAPQQIDHLLLFGGMPASASWRVEQTFFATAPDHKVERASG